MATTEELKTYYKDLLILQYINKANARETIDVLSELAISDQLPLLIGAAFDIDSAVGVQLDTIAKYVGITRYSYGLVSLVDDDFRIAIKIAAIKNSSDSDMFTIQSLIILFFPNNELLVFDYLGMRMSYMIDSSSMSEALANVLVDQGLLMKPMAVGLGTTVYTENIELLFGMRTYFLSASNVSPLQTYISYTDPAPWLSYSMAL